MGRPYKSLIYGKYGKLTVLSKNKRESSRRSFWDCVCDCGKRTIVRGSHLTSGAITSCGCKKEIVDEIGKRYGGLIVVSPFKKAKNRAATWLCRCDCGEYKEISGTALRARSNTSCGCGIHRNKKNTLHGFANTKEYRAWYGMIKRCYDTKNNRYDDYGGRGVSVAEEWKDNKNGIVLFLNYIGPCPSILHSVDRIDTNGNYEPGNVRWSSKKEQAKNRRKYCVISKFSTEELISELRRRRENA